MLMSRDRDGVLFIEDVERFRAGPAEVQRRIRRVAEEDEERYGDVRVVLEQDPGQAGKFEVSHYVRHTLAGFDVHSRRPQGDKIKRAKPWAAQCEAGNVRLVRGAWNRIFISEHVTFPGGKKDQVDGSSGGYKELCNLVPYDPEPEDDQPTREYARDQGGFQSLASV